MVKWNPQMAEVRRRKHLTADQCHAKMVECLDLARIAKCEAHRILLQHMAETWQRIAKELEHTK